MTTRMNQKIFQLNRIPPHLFERERQIARTTVWLTSIRKDSHTSEGKLATLHVLEQADTHNRIDCPISYRLYRLLPLGLLRGKHIHSLVFLCKLSQNLKNLLNRFLLWSISYVFILSMISNLFSLASSCDLNVFWNGSSSTEAILIASFITVALFARIVLRFEGRSGESAWARNLSLSKLRYFFINASNRYNVPAVITIKNVPTLLRQRLFGERRSTIELYAAEIKKEL